MVNFTLPSTTNEMISISTSQTFRSWVVTFHLRQPMAFLSLNLYDTPGLAPRMNVLFWGPGDFPVSYSNRDTSWNAWNRHSGSFMVDTGILFSNMKFPSHECWMTFWPLTNSDYPTNQTFHNSMTLIPTLTFTELRVVSMEHLQRVWHASRERLPFRTPGSVPHFGTCLCSNCWDQIPRTSHVFTRFFTPNTPWYFLDFALQHIDISMVSLREKGRDLTQSYDKSPYTSRIVRRAKWQHKQRHKKVRISTLINLICLHFIVA